MPLSEIDELAGVVDRGENRGQVQKRLAHEVTWLVHGLEEADKAVRASKMLFGEKVEGLSDRDLATVFAEVPSSTLSRDRLADGVNIVDLLVEAGLQQSKGKARKLVEQGGGYVNNDRVAGIEHTVTLNDLASETKLVLRAGKRNYHVISVE
jgi:tyrosyl-tRNA synthetase